MTTTRTRNIPDDIQAGQPGTSSATTIAVFVAPYPMYVKGILARVGAAGTTGTSNTDIRINGTSIFASGASAVQFASGSTTPTYGTIAATNPPKLSKGDVLTVVNTVVHSTPIQNLAIGISFSPQATSTQTTVSTDTLGVENE